MQEEVIRMKDYGEAVSLLRDNTTKKVSFYIHNKCDERELNTVLCDMPFQSNDCFNDDEAHIVYTTNNICAYRIKNDVYIIPATIKAVINNNDGKLAMWFDYPCKMERKDLVKY